MALGMEGCGLGNAAEQCAAEACHITHLGCLAGCVQEYWRSRRVPKDLRKRIISSLNQKHRGRKIIDEDVLLRDITPNLRCVVCWLEGSMRQMELRVCR